MKKWDKKSDGNSPVAWSSWLADEPVPIDQVRPAVPASRQRPATPDEIRRQRLRFAGIARHEPIQPVPPQATDPKQISIHIQLKKPTLSVLRTRAQQLTSRLPKYQRKQVLPVGILVGVGLITLVGFQLFSKQNQGALGDASKTPTTFTPLVPQDDSRVAGANTTLENAEGQAEVLTFPDTFLDKPVTVSQQKLPDDLKGEPDPAGKLATKLGKTDKISTAFGNTYFTTDSKQPVQTLVLVYKETLILITSNTHRDGESWKLYIESLRP